MQQYGYSVNVLNLMITQKEEFFTLDTFDDGHEVDTFTAGSAHQSPQVRNHLEIRTTEREVRWERSTLVLNMRTNKDVQYIQKMFLSHTRLFRVSAVKDHEATEVFQRKNPSHHGQRHRRDDEYQRRRRDTEYTRRRRAYEYDSRRRGSGLSSLASSIFDIGMEILGD